MTTRRQFALGTLSAMCALLFQNGFAQPAAMRTRLEIREFEKDPARVKQLRDAVRALKSRNPQLGDPSSWFNQANIHGYRGAPPSGVPADVVSLWNQCHRDDTYLFFAWHRLYVFYMEKLLQAAVSDASLSLPYWDYFKNPGMPDSFRTGTESANALNDDTRPTFVNSGQPVFERLSLGGLMHEQFMAFQSTVNENPHGRVHVQISGNMGHPLTAGRDPVFWLHHANIDRYLVVWLGMGGARKLDAAQAFSDRWSRLDLKFVDAGPRIVKPTFTDVFLADTTKLGYRYQEVVLPADAKGVPPEPSRVIAGAAGRRGTGIEIFSASRTPKPLTLGREPLAVRLPVDADTSTRMSPQMFRERREGALTTLSVVVNGVTINPEKSQGAASYDVYVNLPKQADSNTPASTHYLGAIEPFDLLAEAEHAHHRGAKGKTLRFNLLPKVAALEALKRWDLRAVTVSFIPVVPPRMKAIDQSPSDAITIDSVEVVASSLPDR